MSVTVADSTRTQRLRRVFVLVGIALAAVALLVEPVARHQLSSGRSVDLGVLQLKLAYNSGVAFSMGDQLPTWAVLTVTASITAGIGVYAWRTASVSSMPAMIGFSLMFAGAAANVIDRGIDGKVTDYFHTGWWPTFNLADTYLTCGVVLLIAALLQESIHTSAKEQPA
ncbi:signal peptidase II [Rhodococcus ruber]|uniref:Lipoprotein signal peptidase n=1 Tax=Rhodococcus ruber TaxID=1830 RepID=A0A098BMU1_9NOCA|nr:signal peptidase II [Rhodococcus ruber]MCD2127234.1 signal peptidase II [Rhodococcus ruber]MCZ4503169.1 signal peptidase II [Rhodococcus ruber]MCZ4530736.1 signal peptidase II [Rhodococcus ruber]MCZ4621564.1 signal peptidase II [Rhodococcus ruber]MDI9969448.1 signal peptidase II [Rhodococcus ruber]